jgi:hypothetical protein
MAGRQRPGLLAAYAYLLGSGFTPDPLYLRIKEILKGPPGLMRTQHTRRRSLETQRVRWCGLRSPNRWSQTGRGSHGRQYDRRHHISKRIACTDAEQE